MEDSPNGCKDAVEVITLTYDSAEFEGYLAHLKELSYGDVAAKAALRFICDEGMSDDGLWHCPSLLT